MWELLSLSRPNPPTDSLLLSLSLQNYPPLLFRFSYNLYILSSFINAINVINAAAFTVLQFIYVSHKIPTTFSCAFSLCVSVSHPAERGVKAAPRPDNDGELCPTREGGHHNRCG